MSATRYRWAGNVDTPRPWVRGKGPKSPVRHIAFAGVSVCGRQSGRGMKRIPKELLGYYTPCERCLRVSKRITVVIVEGVE